MPPNLPARVCAGGLSACQGKALDPVMGIQQCRDQRLTVLSLRPVPLPAPVQYASSWTARLTVLMLEVVLTDLSISVCPRHL